MKRNLGAYIHRYRTPLLRSIYVLWSLGLARLLFISLEIPLVFSNSYYSWEISDWLINYQGGFVRRGLIGECLLRLYQWHPFPINIGIYLFITFTFIILAWFTIRIFKKEGFSYAFLLAPFFFIAAFCFCPLSTRRDYLSLLLMIAIYALYAKYIYNNSRQSMLLMQVLSILTLLLHEAAFFYTIPLLFCHYWLTKYKIYHTWWKTLLMACIFFTPAILTLIMVSLYHGDQQIANAIWSSWQHCMETYPLPNNPEECTVGAGINALTWGLAETAQKHFLLNFGGYFIWKIPACIFTIYNFVVIYYLTTAMNTIDLKINTLKPINQVQLSNFLLTQFVFMLPLFTILSCDSWRTYSYWLVSALVGYYYFKRDQDIIPNFLSNCSTHIQTAINQNKWLTNPWIYILILFTFPMPIVGGPDFFRVLPVKLFYKIIPILQSLL